MNTYWATKGKYARLCIEIDFLKPVISKVLEDDILFNVKYENFSAICFHCGRIGHKLDTCLSSVGPMGHGNPANTVLPSRDQPPPVNSPIGSVDDP